MTHQPPLPAAASPPYPPHPEPISEALKASTRARENQVERGKHDAARNRMIGNIARAGTLIGLGTAAAVAAILAYRWSAPAPGPMVGPRRSSKAGTVEVRKQRRSGGDGESKRAQADRSSPAHGKGYDVSYFARKHGLSLADARLILEEAGADRNLANALAETRHEPSPAAKD